MAVRFNCHRNGRKWSKTLDKGQNCKNCQGHPTQVRCHSTSGQVALVWERCRDYYQVTVSLMCLVDALFCWPLTRDLNPSHAANTSHSSTRGGGSLQLQQQQQQDYSGGVDEGGYYSSAPATPMAGYNARKGASQFGKL